MTKLPSPVTVVTCPICGVSRDLKIDKHALAKHIQSDHHDVSLLQVALHLENELGLSHANNLQDVEASQLQLYWSIFASIRARNTVWQGCAQHKTFDEYISLAMTACRPHTMRLAVSCLPELKLRQSNQNVLDYSPQPS